MYSVYFRKRLSEAKPPFDIPRFNILRFAVPATRNFMRFGCSTAGGKPSASDNRFSDKRR